MKHQTLFPLQFLIESSSYTLNACKTLKEVLKFLNVIPFPSVRLARNLYSASLMPISPPAGYSVSDAAVVLLENEGYVLNFSWKVSKHIAAFCISINCYSVPVFLIVGLLLTVEFVVDCQHPNFLVDMVAINSCLHRQFKSSHCSGNALMIHLRSNSLSEKSKYLPPSLRLFLPALMVSNDKILLHEGWQIFRANTVWCVEVVQQWDGQEGIPEEVISRVRKELKKNGTVTEKWSAIWTSLIDAAEIVLGTRCHH